MTVIGILGLQGDFEAHRSAIDDVGLNSRLVRHPSEFEGLSGLILPGGESTTLLKLARDIELLEPIRRLARSPAILFGTCAGAILLSRRVFDPAQESLGLIDIDIRRNAFGRQQDSFEVETGPEDEVHPDMAGDAPDGAGRLDLVFIRAPRIIRCGPAVQCVVRHRAEPVMVRQGNIMAATFHPEIGRGRAIHGYFAREVRAATAAAPALAPS